MPTNECSFLLQYVDLLNVYYLQSSHLEGHTHIMGYIVASC